MKKYILFIFFILSISCLSQTLEIEKLVNKASTIVVPNDFKYFNLVDSSFILDIKCLISYNPQIQKFIKDNPDFKSAEFLSTSNNLEKKHWHSYKINRVHLYPYNDIPKFTTHLRIIKEVPYKTPKSELDSLSRTKEYNQVIVPVKKWWSKKRGNREIEEKWAERHNNTKLEDKEYFKFSTSIFSLNYEYAVIEVITGGEGRVICVFKKVDDDWLFLSSIYGYIY